MSFVDIVGLCYITFVCLAILVAATIFEVYTYKNHEEFMKELESKKRKK